jgi:RNA-directed DNA polymerase
MEGRRPGTMEQEPQKMLGRDEQKRLVTALRVALMKCQKMGIDGTLWRDMLSQANVGLAPEKLEEMRNLLKATIGYDPLEGDTRPKGEKQPGLTRSEARQPPSLQDLKQKISVKAKAEPAHRFWGLYVHVLKTETLREAYKLAKENDGAPGIDGVTFKAIEESGVEAFLEGIRAELVSRMYRPMRNRRKEIPKDGGRKVRVLGIPSIRDRVVQGALKLILEPIFEADFQPGSFGYRPGRSQRNAIGRVSQAIAEAKTRVIDLDLKAFFDNVRHHILLEKVARRVKDPDVLHLLKMILKASGKKGVPQGGVISPLLSNIYLNEVDKMLEMAKETTRRGKYTEVEYARFADDLVILVSWHPNQDWLVKAVDRRLREELAKIQVEVNEEKTRTADLMKGESFTFLGFRWRRVQGGSGKWRPLFTPLLKKRKELTVKITKIFQRHVSQPVDRIIEEINPVLRGWVAYFRMGSASRCFSYIRDWVQKKVRRHMMRARERRGFGWKRWSTEWIHRVLGLFDEYWVEHYVPPPKAHPCR